MGPPRVVRVALVVAAVAALAPIGPAALIATALFLRAGILPTDLFPWLAVLALGSVGFVASASLIATDIRRARLLAAAAAITVALGASLLGQMGGGLVMPVPAIAAIAAWATFLQPLRRGAVLAAIAYAAVGALGVVPLLGGPADPLSTISVALAWPVWLLLFVQVEPLALWLPLGVAAALAALAARSSPAQVKARP